MTPMDWPAFTPSQTAMQQLVLLSRYYGSDPQFILAAGGNTSCKDEDFLYVKASGAALANIDENGFVGLHRRPLQELLATDPGADPKARENRFKDAVMAARVNPAKGQRPSVECVLHNLLPSRFVAHTHSTVANMLTCCVGGEGVARELFGDDIPWVAYVDPGYVLSRTLHESLRAYVSRTGRRFPPAILMANHGLIVCGDTPEEIRLNTDEVVGKIRARIDAVASPEPFGRIERVPPERATDWVNVIGPALRALLSGNGRPLKIVTFDDSPAVMALAGGEGGRAVAGSGPLTPDQIVYCRSFPLWFETIEGESAKALVERLGEAVKRHLLDTRFPANAILVKGLGLFAAGDTHSSADVVRQVYTDAIKVMSGAIRLREVSFLSKRDREFIEDWEVESYRRSVSVATTGAGRAAGKVAVVTGAAQGFGLEIARDLVAQGAHVALADVNAAGAQAAAADLCAKHGAGRAVGVAMDVASGASVAAALHQVVRFYGGFDALVSNAGVLRAESVKTQSERDFDFVTAVNYKGYFVCVQKAAPILAVPRLARPGYFSDIIQINSKSGLQGSNKNAAYAGSKFGGIGLTQSFALELIEDGIKVNSICPGNFYDGPLWSDPDNGLFVQYLRAGKVVGAKTIADVRRFYEEKAPIKRGCTTADVMKAVYYLIEQEYETGQALPVTGGQVMLS